MPTVTVIRRDAQRPLTAAESSEVLSAAGATAAADGAEPLSEQFRLSLESGELDGVWHLLASSDKQSADEQGSDEHVPAEHVPAEADAAGPGLVGYAQVRPGEAQEPASVELFVVPGARRTGVGSALLDALPADVRIWSHDDSAAARGFASSRGLEPVRSLHVMHRSLTEGPPWPAADVPETYLVRHFEPGHDETAWLAVNAAAFAHHREQGGLDRADLDQRMAQAWFDPAGLILIVPRSAPDEIAAFHWTKVDPPDGSRGEVYVVGVSPVRQGEGLGRAVTILGLDHLRGRGLADVVLYVDEDNVAAVHTYRRLGFVDLEVHRQYARPVVVPTRPQ